MGSILGYPNFGKLPYRVREDCRALGIRVRLREDLNFQDYVAPFPPLNHPCAGILHGEFLAFLKFSTVVAVIAFLGGSGVVGCTVYEFCYVRRFKLSKF